MNHLTNVISAFVVVLLASPAPIQSRFTLPDDFVKCDLKDLNFNECAILTFGKLAAMIVKGVPQLNMLPLDPLQVEHAVFKASPGSPLNMKLELKNITFQGLSNATIISIEGTDVRRSIYQVTGFIPRAKVTASYSIDGKMLYLPLKNHGTTVINLKNMKIKFRSQNQLQLRNETSHTLIKNMTLDTEVESGDVFQKSAEKVNILGLSDRDFNRVLNENFLIMYNEYKPVINELFINLIKSRLMIFNNEVPLDTIFASV